MNQPPQKRRWQFSLKVLFIAMTMAGVGMGLMRLTIELGEKLFSLEQWLALYALFIIGFILLSASPGVLIGYGYERLRGSIFGGLISVGVILLFLMVVEFILRSSV